MTRTDRDLSAPERIRTSDVRFRRTEAKDRTRPSPRVLALDRFADAFRIDASWYRQRYPRRSPRPGATDLAGAWQAITGGPDIGQGYAYSRARHPRHVGWHTHLGGQVATRWATGQRRIGRAWSASP